MSEYIMGAIWIGVILLLIAIPANALWEAFGVRTGRRRAPDFTDRLRDDFRSGGRLP